MVKKLKRIFVLAVAFCMIFTFITGCTKNEPGNGTTTGTTGGGTTGSATAATTAGGAAAKPAEISIFMSERWPGVGFDNFNTKYIEEKTDTKLNILTAPAVQGSEKLEILLMSGKRPDIMSIGDEPYEKRYVEAGILMPLNNYFDKAPNVLKRMEKHIDLFKQPDGNIYTINAITGQDPFFPMYRKDWLDKFGLGIPATMDEFMHFAELCTKNDPDGNNKDDTYALGHPGAGKDLRYLDYIFAAHGTIPLYWLEDDNGNLYNGSITEGAKEALRNLNKLYEMGALDPEFVTDNGSRFKAKWAEGVYGTVSYKAYCFDTFNTFNYYEPFKESNPDGEWVYGPIVKGTGYNEKVGMRALSEKGYSRTAVSATTNEVDAVFRLLDWLASEEGQMFTNYGVEGEHYTMKDGIVTVTIDEAQIQELGITQLPLAQDTLYLHMSKEFQNAFNFGLSLATPVVIDGLIVDEAADYQVALDDYTRTEYYRMIIGDVAVDEGFKAYVAEWNKMGGEELTKAYDAAYKARK